jgi:hypothetical protein
MPSAFARPSKTGHVRGFDAMPMLSWRFILAKQYGKWRRDQQADTVMTDD